MSCTSNYLYYLIVIEFVNVIVGWAVCDELGLRLQNQLFLQTGPLTSKHLQKSVNLPAGYCPDDAAGG